MTTLSRNNLHINISSSTLARSMSVGALGTAVDFAIFTLLQVIFGLPAVVVNTVSYTLGSLNSFSLHRIWTYAGRPQKSLRLQFLQFVLVSCLALGMNNLIIIILTPYFNNLLSVNSYAGLAAKLCATSIGMVWNYTANNRWTFSKVVV
jgi:putative flippase GtrA